MILRYRNDAGEVRDYELRPGKLLSPEVEAIEEVGGSVWDTYDEWGEKFMKGNRRAYRAGLWIMLKRENPTLRFNEVQFAADALTWEYDPEEQEVIKAAIRDAGKELDPDQKRSLLEALGAVEGKDAGKASETSDVSTVSESQSDSAKV